ncbi:tetratricopeptide repeat protein [Sphingomonas sp.]|uniref:tetratricopeptide repeat protein n=1 Tax=Sphingomonas sp. TaxID=28214 RepID=UPI002B557FFA|nr:hypothetical protein [Sphingomonas sp.]HTG39695.1 hypothetical protein [Sphingomonas sp.]
MRFTSVSAALALAAVSISTSLHGQRPDDQIDPRSVALVEKARAARAAGNLSGANDLLESAVVVDPRNRQAFVLIAEVARQQDLPGKSIRFYREALTIEPNDVAALRGQGEVLVQKGAVVKARENLAKIKTLCAAKPCGDATVLAAAIAKGPPVTATAQATVTPPSPTTPAAKN